MLTALGQETAVPLLPDPNNEPDGTSIVEAVLFVEALDASGRGEMESGAVANMRIAIEELLQPYAIEVVVGVASEGWLIVGGDQVGGSLPEPATHRVTVVVKTSIPELIAAVLSKMAGADEPMQFKVCCRLKFAVKHQIRLEIQ
jgi:hypothetical protein